MVILPASPHIPLEVYIETKGMGLVWPEYFNGSTTALRSSIPVHITQRSDKPSQGSVGVESERWGMEMRGWVDVSRVLESISVLYSSFC